MGNSLTITLLETKELLAIYLGVDGFDCYRAYVSKEFLFSGCVQQVWANKIKEEFVDDTTACSSFRISAGSTNFAICLYLCQVSLKMTDLLSVQTVSIVGRLGLLLWVGWCSCRVSGRRAAGVSWVSNWVICCYMVICCCCI